MCLSHKLQFCFLFMFIGRQNFLFFSVYFTVLFSLIFTIFQRFFAEFFFAQVHHKNNAYTKALIFDLFYLFNVKGYFLNFFYKFFVLPKVLFLKNFNFDSRQKHNLQKLYISRRDYV